MQSAQSDLFCFRILVFLQCSVFCLYIYVLPAEKSNFSQAGSSAVHGKFDAEKSEFEAKKPRRVFHSIRRSKLLIFTTRKWVICVILQNAIVCCMHMYVPIFLRSRVMQVFWVFWLWCFFLLWELLAVRNRTRTTNSLHLLLGIKRMGEQTDEVPSSFRSFPLS